MITAYVGLGSASNVPGRVASKCLPQRGLYKEASDLASILGRCEYENVSKRTSAHGHLPKTEQDWPSLVEQNKPIKSKKIIQYRDVITNHPHGNNDNDLS